MSKKLLLADDSITIQKVIGITFANEEYDLMIVDNGDLALEKARADRPDLILSDVFMPGKNGYELAAAVKQDPALKGVPVLLLAGTFEPFDEDKASSSGADGWISKPFESQALIDQVEELLARGAAAAPAVAAEAAVEMPAPAVEEESAAYLGEAIDLDQDASADDDLWGAVSFAEEDLGDELEFEEEVLGFEEESVAPSVPIPGVAESEEEDDFFFADEPLEAAEGPVGKTSPSPLEEDSFVFEEEPLDLSEGAPADQWEIAADEEEDFVFEEDPLELMEEPPSGEQTEMKTTEEAPFEWEEDLSAPESAPAWEDSEEEIFTLEDADILEEEELEIESFATGEVASGEMPSWEEGEEMPAPGLEEDIAEAAPAAAAGEAEEDFAFGEEEPGWDMVEPGPGGEEALAVEEAAAPAEPVSRPVQAPAATDSAAAQVQGLSEEELARVVEKVAGAVIERLAATVLEKIAWEVVPDLAESMIKDELRRLKGHP